MRRTLLNYRLLAAVGELAAGGRLRRFYLLGGGRSSRDSRLKRGHGASWVDLAEEREQTLSLSVVFPLCFFPRRWPINVGRFITMAVWNRDGLSTHISRSRGVLGRTLSSLGQAHYGHPASVFFVFFLFFSSFFLSLDQAHYGYVDSFFFSFLSLSFYFLSFLRFFFLFMFFSVFFFYFVFFIFY